MYTAAVIELREWDQLFTKLDKIEARLDRLENKQNTRNRRLNLKQAAAHLGMHPETLRRKFASGEYPLSLRHGTGRNKHYLSSELDDLMKKL